MVGELSIGKKQRHCVCIQFFALQTHASCHLCIYSCLYTPYIVLIFNVLLQNDTYNCHLPPFINPHDVRRITIHGPDANKPAYLISVERVFAKRGYALCTPPRLIVSIYICSDSWRVEMKLHKRGQHRNVLISFRSLNE